jgi:hypothetical protein
MPWQYSPLVQVKPEHLLHDFHQPEQGNEKKGENKTVPENSLIQILVV